MAIVAAVIVIVTLVVMLTGRVPPVLTLICALVVAGLIGIAAPAELFAGLCNGGVITIAAMLVIAKGVLHTGVVSRATYRLLSGVTTAGEALRRLIPPVGFASALINTTPIVAMLIPATHELEQHSGVPARGVLMPIAHATTLVGSATLIGTSSNLLIAGLSAPSGVKLTMFSFVPIAVPVALVGWGVLLVTAPLCCAAEPKYPNVICLGERKSHSRGKPTPSANRRGVGHPHHARIRARGSPAVRQEGRRRHCPGERRRLGIPGHRGRGADVVGEPEVRAFATGSVSGVPHHRRRGAVRDLEEDEDIQVIAAQSTKRLRKTPAAPGELCLVTAASTDALTDHEMVGLWQKVAGKAPQTGKTWIALSILAAVVLAGSFALVPIELIAVTGAVLMVVTRVMTPRSAARALNWNILAIMAGSVGLGTIVVKSGLGAHISDALTNASGGNTALIVLEIAVGTTLLTNVVTNAAAAAILTPVTLAIAASTGLNPVLLLALIGTCISFTFLNPFSHQTNLMVMQPGGYSSGTFFRFGVPLTLVSLVVVFGVAWALLSR